MKTISKSVRNGVRNKALAVTVSVLFFGFQANAVHLNNSLKTFSTVETNRVWINVTDSNGAFSQTLMGYRSGATDGYDHGLDGAFMNDGAIALASLIGTTRYAIQFKGLPFVATDRVPLSFTASYNGTYTFAIDHMDGFFANTTLPVYIHDTVTNTYNNLKMGGYTFTANTGLYNTRFEIVYTQSESTLVTNQSTFTAASLNVYQNNTSLIFNGGTTELQNIAIYSINGQLLYSNNQINASSTTVFEKFLSQQILIIKVTTKEGSIATKKWLYL